MTRTKSSNLRGIWLIAATYFYFLIFAQFSFIELVNAVLNDALKPLMASMAIAGITGSLLTPRLIQKLGANATLRLALIGCALIATLAPIAQQLLSFHLLSAGTGLFLGILTVALTSNLRTLLSPHTWGLGIGFGTGIAYALANFPPLFEASPAQQSIAAGLAIAAGLFATKQSDNAADHPIESSAPALHSFPYAVLLFLALVWLDSAAFFIIQHTDSLKANSWAHGYLWRNAALHLSVAVLAGILLQQRRAWGVLCSAFALLALASLFLNTSTLGSYGGFLYPAGVSLYSTALVAYPAFLARSATSNTQIAWRAAILYSVAGWFGSANGIGMAEHLNSIPTAFLLIAGSTFLLPTLVRFYQRKRIESLVVTAILGSGILSLAIKNPTQQGIDTVQQGRQVYLAEGCIHCHSRYVRPDTADVEKWGPLVPFSAIKDESPVLIGNRRSGPDLLNVGNRRSRAWLKQHFIDPRSLSHRSPMPSYAYLFADGDTRGEALLDFLCAVSPENKSERFQQIQRWQPSTNHPLATLNGKELFQQHCATCHGENAQGDGPLSSLWDRPPANLRQGPFVFSSNLQDPATLQRIIKFGIPGTQMPGHETLSPSELQALADYVTQLRN